MVYFITSDPMSTQRVFVIHLADGSTQQLSLESWMNLVADAERRAGKSVFVFEDAYGFFRAGAFRLPKRLSCLTVQAQVLGDPVESLQDEWQNSDRQELMRVWKEQLGLLRQNRLSGVSKIENRLIAPIISMERNGLPFQKASWQKQLDDFALELGETASYFRTLARQLGVEAESIQPDLTGQHCTDIHLTDDFIKAILSRFYNKEIDSLSKSARAHLGESEPLERLDRYRYLQKMVRTYGERFLDFVDNRNRLKGHFDAFGTSSGRLSSYDTNLQNLPTDAQFRACVSPGADRVLVALDYGACELRILADFSQEDRLLEAFARGADIHSAVAAEMFGVSVSKTEHAELRHKAKAINFGLMYGMGAPALGRQVGVTTREAQGLLKTYFERFSKVHRYLLNIEAEAQKNRRLVIPSGRQFHFEADIEAHHLKRLARNMPIQGMAADIMKLALKYIYDAFLDDTDVQMVNSVHDEVVLECPKKDAEEVSRKCVEAMKAAHSQYIPLVEAEVSVAVGPHWMH